MAAEKIGRARCPLCSTNRARLSLSRSGLACLTCDGCNLQVFARSGRSDDLLRRLHLPDTEPAPEPAGDDQPAQQPQALPAPAAGQQPAAQPLDVTRRPGWGLFA